MKIFEVVWSDPATHRGWVSKERDFSPLKNKSVGYLIEKKKDHLAFAQSISGNTCDLGEVLSIPKKAIISLKRLT